MCLLGESSVSSIKIANHSSPGVSIMTHKCQKTFCNIFNENNVLQYSLINLTNDHIMRSRCCCCFQNMLIVHCLPLPGQSNGYCSGDWDCSSNSSSPLPCPPTPPLPLPAGGHAGAPCPEHVHVYGDLRPWEWAAPHALHRAHNKVRLI